MRTIAPWPVIALLLALSLAAQAGSAGGDRSCGPLAEARAKRSDANPGCHYQALRFHEAAAPRPVNEADRRPPQAYAAGGADEDGRVPNLPR